jgi:carbon storage regulator
MLVLSRKIGEQITIGGDVRVVVLRVAGGRIQVGIDAPPSKHVQRGELVIESHRPDSQPSRSNDLTQG